MKSSGKISGWLARPLLVAAGLGLVAVSGWYGPMVTASLWHLFHPFGRVYYRGLSVIVPWPWVADTEANKEDLAVTPQGLSLRKMPATSIHHQAPETIFVTVISPDTGVAPEQQTALWLEMFRAAHPEAAFSAATPVTAPPGSKCLRAVYPKKPEDIVWTCVSMGGGWVANLEGHPASEPIFFEIIGRLKR